MSEEVISEYVDIVDQIQNTLIMEDLPKTTRAVLVESMKEIESLRKALTLFSDEFENIQKMDEGKAAQQ
jgi:hypothetical protein